MDCPEETSASFGMEINAEKTKLMTNNAKGINNDIRINGEKLDKVDSFKYLAGHSHHRSGFQASSAVQNFTDNSSTSETEDLLE